MRSRIVGDLLIILVLPIAVMALGVIAVLVLVM